MCECIHCGEPAEMEPSFLGVGYEVIHVDDDNEPLCEGCDYRERTDPVIGACSACHCVIRDGDLESDDQVKLHCPKCGAEYPER
jgi:hypothetical protein